MKLIFESKEEYLLERTKLSDLKSEDLEKLLGQLYQKRYVEQDVDYESYYRLVSSVYTQRKMDSRKLLFHMKKFVL